MQSDWQKLCEMCGVSENTKLTSEKKNSLLELLSGYNFVIKSCSDSRFKWRAVTEGTYFKLTGFGNSFEEASLNLLVQLYPQLPQDKQQAVEEILKREEAVLSFSFTIN